MSILSKFKLVGKNALVTGASRGIGKAIAIGLAEAGANVAINYFRSKKEALEVKKIIKEDLNKEAIIVQADVAKYEEVKNMVESVIKEFKHIDILVNNSGIVFNQEAQDFALEKWKRVLDVNLDGTFYCCQLVGRKMIEQGGGSIINISSICSKIIQRKDSQIAYHASKGGVKLLTMALSEEWAKYNVRVNAVAPGYTRTDMCPTGPHRIDIIPMERIAEPEEMQGVIVFLSSSAASYITGQEIFVDGGYSICGAGNIK
jgi:NAD(P)-dependent dehydrogenase (short-subunit alcohol dehydrogenase family)